MPGMQAAAQGPQNKGQRGQASDLRRLRGAIRLRRTGRCDIGAEPDDLTRRADLLQATRFGEVIEDQPRLGVELERRIVAQTSGFLR
jgi:hypothetical protein